MSLYLIVAFLLYQVYQVPLVKNLQGVLSEISRDFCVTIAFTQKIRKTEDNKILFNFTFFVFNGNFRSADPRADTSKYQNIKNIKTVVLRIGK